MTNTICLLIITYVCIAHIVNLFHVMKNKSNSFFSNKDNIIECYLWLPILITIIFALITYSLGYILDGLRFLLDKIIFVPIIFIKDKSAELFHTIFESLHLL